jgi:hypothetical protein
MTKPHFDHAASMVRAILAGEWTNELPDWAQSVVAYGYDTYPRVRAVQTAEAFLLLFTAFNPRFKRDRFLKACGLIGE